VLLYARSGARVYAVGVNDAINTVPHSLAELGWTSREKALFFRLAEEGFTPARVTRVDRGLPLVATGTDEGVVRAEPATHLVKTRGNATSRVVVGDWVALSWHEGHEMPVIEAIPAAPLGIRAQRPGRAG
jgi:hypothetical protein